MLKNYRRKLDDIENNLLRMVDIILTANSGMLNATKEKDYDFFGSCEKQLKVIEDLAFKVDNTIVTTLALFSPEAKDLRELVAILKITNELSRARSNVKNYALDMKKYFAEGLFDERTINNIILLQESSIKSFRAVVEMIKSDDENESEKLYNSILVEEDKADELYLMIEQEVLATVCDNSKISVDKMNSLKAIRKLEKVTDRAVGVADLIMFAQTGGEITH